MEMEMHHSTINTKTHPTCIPIYYLLLHREESLEEFHMHMQCRCRCSPMEMTIIAEPAIAVTVTAIAKDYLLHQGPIPMSTRPIRELELGLAKDAKLHKKPRPSFHLSHSTLAKTQMVTLEMMIPTLTV